MSTDSHRIRRNSIWMMGETVARQAISLVLTIWITRSLGPVGFGRLSFALSLCALFQIVTTLGLNRIAVREFAAEPDLNVAGRVLSTGIAMRLFASAIVTLITILSCLVIAPADLALVLILVPGYFFTAFDLIDLFFQSQLRSPAVTWRRFLAFVASSSVKAILLFFGASVETLAFAYLLDWIFAALALTWVYRKKLGSFALPRLDWTLSTKLFAESKTEIVAAFSGIAFMRIDQLMLQAMRGPTDVAIMAVSTRLTEAWYFVPVSVVASTFPVIVRLNAYDSCKAATQLIALYRSLALLGTAVGLATTVLARPLIRLLYGAPYLDAAAVLTIQIWCGIFMSLGIASGAWLMSQRLGILNLRRNIAGVLINVVLNLALIPTYGALGSAWATLAAFVCAYLIYDFLDPATRAMGLSKLRALAFR